MSKLFEVMCDGVRVTLHADHVYGVSSPDGKVQFNDGNEMHSVDCTYEQFVTAWRKALDDERIEVVQEPEWRAWKGGTCPVRPGTLVDVRHRDGEEYRNVPAIIRLCVKDWSHTDDDGDIVAYRVCKVA